MTSEDLKTPAPTSLDLPVPSGDLLVENEGEHEVDEVPPGGLRSGEVPPGGQEVPPGGPEGLSRVSKDEVLKLQGILHLKDDSYVRVTRDSRCLRAIMFIRLMIETEQREGVLKNYNS